MNKIDTITRITAKVLDKYRNSIPRKAFIDAMDRVKEEAIEASTETWIRERIYKKLNAHIPK